MDYHDRNKQHTMMKHLFFLTLLSILTPKFICAQTNGITPFIFLEAGLPLDDQRMEARTTVASSWKISYKTVSGCMVSEKLMDSINAYNETTNQRLKKTYGDEWKVMYETAIEREYKLLLKEKNIFTIHHFKGNITEEVEQRSDETEMTVTYEYADDTKRSKKRSLEIFTNLQDSRDDLLYRGFKNILRFNHATNFSLDQYTLKCEGCKIRKIADNDTLKPHHFALLPSGAKTASILITAPGEEPINWSFNVQNLPVPEIHFNGKKSGEPIDLNTLDSSSKVTIEYVKEITLKAEFAILKWQLYYPEIKTPAHGMGSEIDSKTLEQIKRLPAGTTFSFICTVVGLNDNIRRQIAGAFIVK